LAGDRCSASSHRTTGLEGYKIMNALYIYGHFIVPLLFLALATLAGWWSLKYDRDPGDQKP